MEKKPSKSFFLFVTQKKVSFGTQFVKRKGKKKKMFGIPITHSKDNSRRGKWEKLLF